MNLDHEVFEQMVRDGINAIPQKFLEKLNNVAIVIEDEPTDEQVQKMDLEDKLSLFGLYEGIPLTERDTHYFGVLPDKITIFKRAIEEEAKNEDDIREIVKITVWHEIAHYFGMDEEEVRREEEKRFGSK